MSVRPSPSGLLPPPPPMDTINSMAMLFVGPSWKIRPSGLKKVPYVSKERDVN